MSTRSKQYKEYLGSDDWKQKRTSKLSRSGNRRRRCAICAATSNLDVHHLNYKDLYTVAQSDLRLLCRRCHFLAHDLYKAGKFKFRSTNHHSRFAIIKVAVKKHLALTNTNLFTGNTTKTANRVTDS